MANAKTANNHQKLAGLAAIAIALNLTVQPVLGSSKRDPAVAVFNEKCSLCHTIGGGSLVGPDLAPVATWNQRDAALAIKRMEKNVGPLSDDDVNSLVKFLADINASKLLKAPESQAVLAFAGGEVEKGSLETGKHLFSGMESFKNGGLACIACHQIDGVGGTMAPNLTNIATSMGETALASACQQTSFKVMRAAYHNHPVTKQEALDLTYYFASLKAPHGKGKEAPMPLYGVAFAIIALAVIGIGYHNRNTGIRKRLKRR